MQYTRGLHDSLGRENASKYPGEDQSRMRFYERADTPHFSPETDLRLHTARTIRWLSSRLSSYQVWPSTPKSDIGID